jgi:Flp pilus assembly protein TadD
MRTKAKSCLSVTVAVAAAAILFVLCAFPASSAADKTGRSRRVIEADLRFGAEMAVQGLWREALFRWERVLADRPDDPHVLNNMGVAYEALGDFAKAREVYARAASLSRDRQIASNLALFQKAQAPAPASVPGSAPVGSKP